jgi:hypothetical protein
VARGGGARLAWGGWRGVVGGGVRDARRGSLGARGGRRDGLGAARCEARAESRARVLARRQAVRRGQQRMAAHHRGGRGPAGQAMSAESRSAAELGPYDPARRHLRPPRPPPARRRASRCVARLDERQTLSGRRCVVGRPCRAPRLAAPLATPRDLSRPPTRQDQLGCLGNGDVGRSDVRPIMIHGRHRPAWAEQVAVNAGSARDEAFVPSP